MKGEKSKITIIALFTMLWASTLIPALSFKTGTKPLSSIKSSTPSPGVLSESSNPGSSVIVFDQSHGQYYDASLLSDFIAMLREDGNEVIINNGTQSITKGLLDAADILIITNPDILTYKVLTPQEQDAIHDFLSENGSLLIMGTWYKYFELAYLKPITGRYGIWWNDTQVIDKTDNNVSEYYPLIHNWTANAAPFITGGVTHVQADRSTCLAVSGEAVPIGVGDDDTYAEAPTDPDPASPTKPVINGSNVVVFAAVDLPDGGRIFASGGSQMLQYIHYFNNTLFAKNIIGWLEEEVRIKPPTTTITRLWAEYPPELDVLPLRDNVTIKANITNFGHSEATNINATIYWPPVVTNQSKKTVDIPNLAPGQSYVADWKLEGILIGPGTITVEVKSSLPAESFSAKVDISVVNDIRILKFDAAVVFTPISNQSTVNATIKNIASLITHDVILELVLPPSGITSTQPLTVNLGNLDPGNVRIVIWNVTVEEPGFYELTLNVTTTDGGNPTAEVLLLAVKEKLLIYDNWHGAVPPLYIERGPPYIDAKKAERFIGLMRERGEVYISNSTLSRGLLSVTRLLVIPSPREPYTYTTEEIEAIKNYVESGGALFIIGTYYAFFDPSWYDPITSEYGIQWVKGSMRDANDHDTVYGFEYFVLLDTFPDNELANRLKVGVENIKMSGTTMKITDPSVNPIVTGDADPFPNNTVTRDNGNILHEFNGTKTIPLAGVELTGGGKIIASGSDFMIRSDMYGFFEHNEQFLRNLLSYLLAVEAAPEVEITLGIPATAHVDEDITVSVTVENKGNANATDVEVEISPSTGLTLVNTSAILDVELLEAGKDISLVYVVKASEVGSYTVTVTVTFWNGTDFETVTKKSSEISVSEKPGITWVIYVVIAVVVIVVIAAVAYLIIRRRPSA